MRGHALSLEMPERYGRVVTPVFREVEHGYLAPIGSAVLLRANDGSGWLVSAAHVLAELTESKLVLAPNGSNYFYLVIDSTVYSTCELTPECAFKDKQDIAFVRLDPSTSDQLIAVGFNFLPLEVGEQSIISPVPRSSIIVAYPCDQIEVESGSPVSISDLRAASALFGDDEVKKRFKLDPAIHVASPFGDFVDSTKSRIKALNPEGMSGGAIWTTSGLNPSLVGVITMFDPKRRAIIATRVAPVIREINRLTRIKSSDP